MWRKEATLLSTSSSEGWKDCRTKRRESKAKLNKKGYAVNLRKYPNNADGCMIKVVGKLKTPPTNEETPFEALNRVVKTIRKNKPQPADNQHTTQTTFDTTKKKNIKAI